ncbi:hypothetical protein DPMN_126309 [Dreissena polymorpha]|uniref:Uncharacterized protein n=1 Tax=Dreissena polymorpha TaxID=45954 RepID=A0A9D4GZ47_DREPO|nr:hypothetical protein DPMN_126309 [Dreissena polymorpha]
MESLKNYITYIKEIGVWNQRRRITHILKLSYSLTAYGITEEFFAIPGEDMDILASHVSSIRMLMANDNTVTRWFQTSLEV